MALRFSMLSIVLAIGCGSPAIEQDGGPDGSAVDCTTAGDGTSCGPSRICVAGACAQSVCGDSIVDPASGEQCDDGNTTAFDGCTDCRRDCAAASDCDDGDPCNGVETCDRSCVAGTPLAAGSPCSTASVAAGVCLETGGRLLCRDASCGDGVVATDGSEQCDDGRNGDDTDGCRDDCTFTCSVDADCDDGDFCNGAEVCTAAHRCEDGPDPSCDDGVACTVDGCAAGACTHTTMDALCDDGVDCTSDRCTPTGCVQALEHARCNDGVACTGDVCTPSGCSFPVDHSRCSDGVACTNDVCTPTGCSSTPDGSRCSDGVACTDDSCGPGGCVFTPSHSRCDDGIACTVDTCTPGGCVNTPSHALCPASSCNSRTCSAGVGCVSTGAIANCRMVGGRQIFAVDMDTSESGNTTCAAHGLRCLSVPIFSPPSQACLAFHPGAPVTSNFNGWRQSVYCNGEIGPGSPCGGGVSCHDCPACLGLSCSDAGSPNFDELYVECGP